MGARGPRARGAQERSAAVRQRLLARCLPRRAPDLRLRWSGPGRAAQECCRPPRLPAGRARGRGRLCSLGGQELAQPPCGCCARQELGCRAVPVRGGGGRQEGCAPDAGRRLATSPPPPPLSRCEEWRDAPARPEPCAERSAGRPCRPADPPPPPRDVRAGSPLTAGRHSDAPRTLLPAHVTRRQRYVRPAVQAARRQLRVTAPRTLHPPTRGDGGQQGGGRLRCSWRGRARLPPPVPPPEPF